jgi:hypothetical protein
VFLGSFWGLYRFWLFGNSFISWVFSVVHRFMPWWKRCFWWLSAFAVLSSSVVWWSDCWFLFSNLLFSAYSSPFIGSEIENETVVELFNDLLNPSKYNHAAVIRLTRVAWSRNWDFIFRLWVINLFPDISC